MLVGDRYIVNIYKTCDQQTKLLQSKTADIVHGNFHGTCIWLMRGT
jgi:hypothetical protein